MSTPPKRQIRRRKLSKRRNKYASEGSGRWSTSSMPDLLPSRFSTDSTFSWHSSPPRVPTPPLTFDGSDWYADDAFPRPMTVHDKFRYQEQAHAASFADTKTPPLINVRRTERLSLSVSYTYYPLRSSPLTMPPDPEDPEPNVPVPFPPKEVPVPSTETQTELKRTTTHSKLRKKRRDTVFEESYSVMIEQMDILSARSSTTSPEELGTPNMLLLRRCFVEKYIPPGPKEDGHYPFAILSRLSLVH
ncbi:hypothetical protein CPB84DRAFT_1829527 [Gymnopilus junonius]|uniref:Uncharacterized protein n=1 Tax=Gymnopilus junonius TaxID=109634 RepID=A0A9P5N7Y9_GYMJU|nr:hypothetical protein CPB84DRAFT_1829527 [Gymnopilus junonius]